MIEKKFPEVTPQSFTLDGTTDGKVNVVNTLLFKVKQLVIIQSSTVLPIILEVKRINSSTQLQVGPQGGAMVDNFKDISAYLVANGANILAEEQNRSPISQYDVWRAVYDEEPTVALRTIPVDALGNKYSSSNPFPVSIAGTSVSSDVNIHDAVGNPFSLANPLPVKLSDGSISIETLNAELNVRLDHRDNFPLPGDVHSSLRIGDGTTEAGVTLANELKVNASQSGTWSTGRTWTLSSGTDSVNVGNFPLTFPVTQSTSPWVVSGTVAATQNGTWNIGTLTSITNPVSVSQNTSPWVVSGTVAATQSGTWTVQQGSTPWSFNLSQVGGSSVSIGQALMAASIPVVIASDQSAIPVSQSGTWNIGIISSITNPVTVNQGTNPWVISGTVSANQSGAWTTGRTWTLASGTDSVSAVQSGTWNINNITGTISLPTGASTSALQTTGNASLASIDSKLTSPITVTVNNFPTDADALAQGSSTSGQLGSLIMGAVTTGVPTYSTGQTNPLSLDLSGLLRISLKDTPSNTNKFLVTADPITFAYPQHVLVDSGTITANQGTSPWVVSGTVAATQSGTWTTGRTWTLASGTDSISAVQSGTWNIGTVSSITNPVAVTQSTSPWVISGIVAATQSGTWITGRTWTLASGTDSISAVQSGTWTVQQGSAPWSITQSSGPWTMNLTQIGGSSLSFGQALAASSIPVVTQSDALPATQTITTQDLVSVTTAQANGQNAITGTPTAGSFASFSVSSFESVEVQVTGTWTGTLQTEVSMDGGTTWFTRGVKQAGASYISSSFTQNFAGGSNLSGMTNYRVRATAAMTGTVTVRANFSINPGSVTISNPLTLRDSTTQSVANTIKPASTAAAATDTAIVVAISPNNTVAVTQSTSPWITKDQADGTTGSSVPSIAQQVGGKNTSGNLQSISIDRNGFTNVNINADKSVFGPLVVLERVQQLAVDFSESVVNNNLNQTVTGTGTVSLSNSNATISSGTGATSSSQLQTIGTIVYQPGREIYAQFTAAFTTPTSSASSQLAGLYNGTDGLVLGFNGLNFSIISYAGGTPTAIASSSFNLDTLTGGANSQFTRNGSPEAVNFTFKNIYRIRAGWLGAAPIYFEILSPDGNWVTFHMIRQPNTSVNPAFLQPSLPFTMAVTKTSSDSTNLQLVTTSWDAGIVDVSAGVDISNSGSIAALNQTVVINTAERSTVVVDVTGTWAATLTFQGDVGDGTWNSIYAINTNAVSSQTTTVNGTYIISCAGYAFVRLIATAYTSGSANVNWVASQGIHTVLAQVVGNITSGSADSGNPVKTGGVYNSTQTAVSNGQRVDHQSDIFGDMAVGNAATFAHVTTGTTTIKTGNTLLYAICSNNATAGATLTVYDNTTGTGTVFAVITDATKTAPYSLQYGGVLLGTGLTVVVSGGPGDWTIIYK